MVVAVLRQPAKKSLSASLSDVDNLVVRVKDVDAALIGKVDRIAAFSAAGETEQFALSA